MLHFLLLYWYPSLTCHGNTIVGRALSIPHGKRLVFRHVNRVVEHVPCSMVLLLLDVIKIIVSVWLLRQTIIVLSPYYLNATGLYEWFEAFLFER